MMNDYEPTVVARLLLLSIYIFICSGVCESFAVYGYVMHLGVRGRREYEIFNTSFHGRQRISWASHLLLSLIPNPEGKKGLKVSERNPPSFASSCSAVPPFELSILLPEHLPYTSKRLRFVQPTPFLCIYPLWIRSCVMKIAPFSNGQLFSPTVTCLLENFYLPGKQFFLAEYVVIYVHYFSLK